MSLFALRDGVRVLTVPTGGGRIVHLPSGDTLAISAEEVIFLARATAAGLDPRDPEVKGELDRFAGFRVLTAAQLTAGVPLAGPKEPTAPWAATDAAPRFLSTLTIGKPGLLGLVDVQDPARGRSFLLHDFELSLGRMLDGRRQVSEVLESAARLGIPITLAALNRFLHHLQDCHLLSVGADPEPAEAKAMWGSRWRWDEPQRRLFQSGLRMHREGLYPQAAGYFQAMLEQDPKNAEAAQLLERTQLQLPFRTMKRSTDKVEKFDPLWLADAPTLVVPGPVLVPVPFESPGFPDEVTEAHGLAVAEVRAGLEEVTDAHLVLPTKSRRPVLLGAAAGLLALSALAAGWLYFGDPSPARPEDPATVRGTEPVGAARPEAPAAAITARGTEPAGAARPEAPAAAIAARGTEPAGAARPEAPAAAIAAPGTEPAGAARPEAPAAAIAARGTEPVGAARPEAPAAARGTEPVGAARPEAPAAAIAARGTEPVAAARPEAPAAASAVRGTEPASAVRKANPVANAGPAGAGGQPSRWLSFRIQQRGRVNMGDLVAASDGVLSWRAAPEQRVKRNEAVATVSGEAGPVPLVAAAPGLVIQKVPDRAAVKQAQVLGSILYFEAYLKTRVTGVRPEPGWRCTVAREATGEEAPCKVGSVVPRGDGFFLTAVVEPRWFDDAPDAVLRVAPPD